MTSKFSSPLGKQAAKPSGTGSLDVRLDPKSLLGVSGDLSLASAAAAGSDASTHLRDICMAHVITSLADRTIGNPGLMLQRLLDFSPADYDDLLLALAESGCSYVDILAAYIHNLRIVAQDNASQRGVPQEALVGGITEKFNDLLSEITKASHVASPNPKRRQAATTTKQRATRSAAQNVPVAPSDVDENTQLAASGSATSTTPRPQRAAVEQGSSTAATPVAGGSSQQAPSVGTPQSTSSAHSVLQQPQLSGEALSEKSVASTSSTTPLTQAQQQQHQQRHQHQAPAAAQHLVFFPGAASSNPMHDMHAGLLLPGMADLSTPPPAHHAPKLRSYWSENLEDARYSHGSADLPSLMQSPHQLRTSHDFSTPSSGVGMSAFQSTPLSQHPLPEDPPSGTPEDYHPAGSTTDQYMAELAAAAMQIQMPPMQPQLMLLPNGMPFALSPAAAAAAAAAANGGAEMSVLQLSEDMYCNAGALNISQMSSMLSVGSSHAEPLPSFHSLPWNSIWQ